jgi:O-antigen/teichoic acid export membrane protein
VAVNIRQFFRVINSKSFIEIFLLIVAQFFGMLGSFLFNSLAAKEVSTDTFGEFSLVLSVVTLAVMLCNLGFYSSMPVVLAGKITASTRRELIGSCFLIAILCGVVVTSILLFFGGVIDGYLGNPVSYIFVSCWIFIIFAPFKEVLLQVGKGLKDTRILVLVRLGIPFLMVLGLISIQERLVITLYSLTVLQFASITAVAFVAIFLLKPNFTNLRNSLKIISFKNKEYGTRVYISHIFALSWPEMIVFIIPLYASMTDLAYYRVALLLVAPLIVVSQNIGTYFFRNFALKNELSHKIILMNIGLIIVQLLVYYSLIEYLLLKFFGNSYQSSLPLIYVMAVGAAVISLCQLPSAYLNANSQGNSILVSSIVMFVTAILVAALFVPKYGAIGAAYAYVLSGVAYCIIIHFFFIYFRVKSSQFK